MTVAPVQLKSIFSMLWMLQRIHWEVLVFSIPKIPPFLVKARVCSLVFANRLRECLRIYIVTTARCSLRVKQKLPSMLALNVWWKPIRCSPKIRYLSSGKGHRFRAT